MKHARTRVVSLIERSVLCLLLAGVSFGADEEPRPETVQILLEAQGSLEAARHISASLSPSERKKLQKDEDRANAFIKSAYPACRAILSKDHGERIGFALQDIFLRDLAARVCPGIATNEMTLSPVFPDNDGQGFSFGKTISSPAAVRVHFSGSLAPSISTDLIFAG
jgi:hypothetical protein